MIEARGLTKRYGSTVAVDGLSFDVRPGSVTGFLGPNGSGKSTTMRMIMGLDYPHAGQARIGGRPYRELRWPLREVGALLEARAFHPGRSARAHLTALAASNDIPASRVDVVLGTVGLLGGGRSSAAGRRAGKFSLGTGIKDVRIGLIDNQGNAAVLQASHLQLSYFQGSRYVHFPADLTGLNHHIQPFQLQGSFNDRLVQFSGNSI